MHCSMDKFVDTVLHGMLTHEFQMGKEAQPNEEKALHYFCSNRKLLIVQKKSNGYHKSRVYTLVKAASCWKN